MVLRQGTTPHFSRFRAKRTCSARRRQIAVSLEGRACLQPWWCQVEYPQAGNRQPCLRGQRAVFLGCARQPPRLSEGATIDLRDVQCEILDLREVVPLTSEYVSKAGVSAQVSIRGGDMLHDNFGSGYDIIMLNAICHMFSEEQNLDIFRRARQALAQNGRLVVQDFILNPDKAGPQHAALFSVNMLVGTDAGATYSEPEYTSWMKAAGFTDVRRIKLPGPSDLIVGQVK